MTEHTPKQNTTDNKRQSAKDVNKTSIESEQISFPPSLGTPLASSRLTQKDIILLQRTIGNQAVRQLLGRPQTAVPREGDPSSGKGAASNQLTQPIHTPTQTLLRDENERQFEQMADETTPEINRQPDSSIQRELDERSTRALDTAKTHNALNYGDDVKNQVDSNVTIKEQGEINTVRGRGFHAASPQDEKNLKDVIRAYLLKTYAGFVPPVKTTYATTAEEKEAKASRARKFSRTLKERDKQSGIIEKGFGHPETRKWLEFHGFGSILPASSKLETGEPTIDVRSTFIGGAVLGMNFRSHLFIVLTTGDGKQYYFRGGPSGGTPSLTVADYGEYTPAVVDWDTSAPSVTVMRGDEVMQKLDLLIEAAKAVNTMQVPYEAGGPGKTSENCNATAWTMLNRAGIPTRKPSGVHSGWGHVLGTESGKGNQIAPKEVLPDEGLKYLVKSAGADVWHDRDSLEKAPKLAGNTPVDLLISRNDLYGGYLGVRLPIRYDGDKIGYTFLNFLEPGPGAFPSGKKMNAKRAGYVFNLDTDDTNYDYIDETSVIEVLDDTWAANPVNSYDKIKIKYIDSISGQPRLGRVQACAFFEVDPPKPKKEEDKKVEAEAKSKVVAVDPQDQFENAIQPSQAYLINSSSVTITKADGRTEITTLSDGHKVEVVGQVTADMTDDLVEIHFFDWRTDQILTGYVQAWWLRKAI